MAQKGKVSSCEICKSERSIIVFNALSSLVRRARKFFCTLSASVSTIGKSIVKLSDHAT